MKDDHKNMLLGFLAAKSKQSGQPSNWQTAMSQLNFLQKLWLVPFYFSLWALLAASIIFLVGTISFLLFSGEASTVVPTFWIFTGGREIAIVIVFIILASFIFYKILFKILYTPRKLFWWTFAPSLLVFLIWMFGPIIGIDIIQLTYEFLLLITDKSVGGTPPLDLN